MLFRSLLTKSLKPCEQALKDAGLQAADIDDVILVGGMTRMPKVTELVKNFFGKDPNKGVNPDEVVASGAAIQGGILAKDESVGDMLLIDVTPLSLGLETLGGICTFLIERNTTIPAKKTETFSTAADNQTAVDISVFQGERKMAKSNRLLGNFRLEGIEMAPRGIPQIEVTFDINADGILKVTAKDKKTGKSQDITIKSSGGLSEEEINQMKSEAEQNAVDDERQVEIIETTNKLDSEIYQIGKMLDENRDKLPENIAAELDTAIQEAIEAKDSGDLENMTAASEKLVQIAQNMQQMASQAQQAGSAEAVDPQPTSSDDDIIDVTPEG